MTLTTIDTAHHRPFCRQNLEPAYPAVPGAVCQDCAAETQADLPAEQQAWFPI